jgi:hypothetical protein
MNFTKNFVVTFVVTFVVGFALIAWWGQGPPDEQRVLRCMAEMGDVYSPDNYDACVVVVQNENK